MDLAQPVLLVDVSHCVFHAYFEAFHSYACAQRLLCGTCTDPDGTMPDTPACVQRFAQAFEQLVQRSCVRAGRVPACNVVLVKDCPRDLVWRRRLYGGYKKNRDTHRASRFNSAFFRHTYEAVLPAMQAKHGVHTIEVETAEADDVAAMLLREIRARSPATRVTVLTNDNDYVQLLAHDPLTAVLNAHGTPLQERVKLPPHIYAEAKFLLGDRSDNIPPVLRRMTGAHAEQLVRDRAALEALLDADAQARQGYELNRALMDMRLIPDDVRERFAASCGCLLRRCNWPASLRAAAVGAA